MKMQGPENHGGLSADGKSYEPDADGVIDIPETLLADALAHGFAAAVEKPKKKLAKDAFNSGHPPGRPELKASTEERL